MKVQTTPTKLGEIIHLLIELRAEQRFQRPDGTWWHWDEVVAGAKEVYAKGCQDGFRDASTAAGMLPLTAQQQAFVEHMLRNTLQVAQDQGQDDRLVVGHQVLDKLKLMPERAL